MDASQNNILRIALLVFASAAHHISSTPPRVAENASNHLLLPQEEQISKAKAESEALHGCRHLNRLGMVGVASSKYVVWMAAVVEVVTRLLSIQPEHPLSATFLPYLLPSHLSHATATLAPTLLTPPTNLFVISTLSILIGYVIRKACFSAMGRLFTFTHTTLSGHQLVTGGPYSIVRHPSYTGEVLVRGGMIGVLLSPGGWISECGVTSLQQFDLSPLQTALVGSMRIGLAFYIGWVVFACTYLILRAPREDETLHSKFGKEWEDYSKRVPWRFIPHVA